MKFKNHHNAGDFPDKGEVNHSPSKTVPDQNLTVRELLIRHTRGLPIPASKSIPIYDEEDYGQPDFSIMDLAEIEQFQRDANEELLEIAKRSRTAEFIKKREERKRQSKPNQGTQALETVPTEAKSTPKS